MNNTELLAVLDEADAVDQQKKNELLGAIDDADRSDTIDSVISTVSEFSGELVKRFPGGVAGVADLASYITPLHFLENVTGKDLTPSIKERYDKAVPVDRSTTAKQLGGNVGEELGAAIIPAGSLLKLAKYAERAPKFIRGILQAAERSPKTFLGGEALAAAGAGGGRTIAQDAAPESPMAEVAGQIAGSFITVPVDVATGITRAYSRSKIDPEDIAGFVLKKQIGGEEAAKRLAENIRRGKEATAFDSDFTSGMLSNDPSLLALEKSIIHKNGQLSGRYKEARQNIIDLSNKELESSMSGQQAPRVMVDFLEGRADKLIKQIDERVSVAVKNAAEQAASPSVSREVSSKIFRSEMDEAEQIARATERNAWNQVDSSTYVDVNAPIVREDGTDGSFVTRIDEMLKGKTLAQSLPSARGEIKTLFKDLRFLKKKLSEGATVKDLQGIRSEILERLRTERGADRPNRKLIAAHNEIQGLILDAMTRTEAGGPLKAALSVSRKVNDMFTRGTLGDVLGYSAKGDMKVTDAETLRQFILPGEAGGVAADDMIRALGGNERAMFATRQYLYDSFYRQVAPDGLVRPDDAARWMANHEELLGRFPDVKKKLSNAADAQTLVNNWSKTADKYRSRLMQERASLFIQVDGRSIPPERALKKILDSGKPKSDMKKLLRVVDQDKTGMAREGLKSAFHENFVMNGDTPRNLKKNLAKLEKTGVISELYTPMEIARVKKIIATREMADRIQNAGTRIGSDTVEKASVLLSFEKILAGYAGAYAASFINPRGGGSIRTSSKMIQFFEYLFDNSVNPQTVTNAEQLIEEAVFNPEIMETLLMRPTRENLPIIQRRLRGHLFNMGAISNQDEQEAAE